MHACVCNVLESCMGAWCAPCTPLSAHPALGPDTAPPASHPRLARSSVYTLSLACVLACGHARARAHARTHAQAHAQARTHARAHAHACTRAQPPCCRRCSLTWAGRARTPPNPRAWHARPRAHAVKSRRMASSWPAPARMGSPCCGTGRAGTGTGPFRATRCACRPCTWRACQAQQGTTAAGSGGEMCAFGSEVGTIRVW